MTTKQNKGFTLLEILLVIAAIGILASIVLVAINPNRQLGQVRDASRRSDINTIYKALEQYLIDTGSYPSSINTKFKEICNTGIEQVGGATDCSEKADLRVLVPTYLAAIPKSPSGGVYRVNINGNNKLEVYTIGYNNQIIALNFNDTDANNYIAAVEIADGQALEDNVKIAINDFIIGLKTDGIWEPIKASVIMAGARTLNGALVPLKGPTPTNFNFVSGDYDRKTGLAGDGSTKYLDSSFDNQDVPHADIHQCVYVTTPGSIEAGYIGGPFIGNSHDLTEIFRGSTAIVFRNRSVTAAYTASGQQNSTGFMGTSRDNNTEFDYRFNNVTGTKAATFPVNYVIRDINVFRRALGLSGSTPTDARLAFYSIGESLDLALLDTRVSQLMTDLGNAIP